MKVIRVLFLFLFLFIVTIGSMAASAAASSDGSVTSRTGLDRTEAALALHEFNLERQGRPLTGPRRSLSRDQGDVSVMQDDGTLVVPLNRFDLTGKSLTFTPQGTGYIVQSGSVGLDIGQGAAVTVQLGDDDSTTIALPFPFTFYGTTYNSIFLNTDGNLTFNSADADSTSRNLRRVKAGPPRIAPLFDDLNPGTTGRITVEKLSDRVIVSWSSVGEFASRSARSTFQAVLQANGIIRFNYQTVSVSGAVVGLSPGNASLVSLTDLSQQDAPTFVSGVVAEVFSSAEQLDLAAIAANFYETHQDVYDHLMIFTDFDINLQDAFAFEIPVRNGIQGIMPGPGGIFDLGVEFGSARRLAAIVNGGAIGQYPDDPRQIFLGTNNTLDVLGQEFGHRWLAFIDTTPSLMLGRDLAHWSFFMNTLGSVMEGNEIEDLGNGRFRTVGATYQYSPLDQYIMGLRAPSDVPPWFVVTNPRLISAPSDFTCRTFNPACPPAVGVEMQGTRRDLTIQDVISIAGPRIPSSATSQKDFAVAYILITSRNREANAKSVLHLDNIRRQWEQFFVQAVGGRATMATRLQSQPPAITAVLPAQGLTIGGTEITVQGSGFQPDSAVSVGGNDAIISFVSSTLIEVTAPRAEHDGTVGITVTNPDGQAATIPDAFLYISSPVTQLELAPLANGSLSFESAPSPSIRVGYGIVESAAGVAILKSFAGGTLVSEAAIPASPTATRWVMYSEQSNNVATGVAIANPNSTIANISLTLSNGRSAIVQIPPRGQRAAFVGEFISDLGSFLGTLTLQSDIPVSVLSLRGSVNNAGRFIMATIPLSSRTPAVGGIVTFPLTVDGSGYNTELILVNTGSSTSSGTIQLSFDVHTDAGTGNRFTFSIPAGQVWRLRTLNSAGSAITGYAVISADPSSPMPESTAMIRLSANGDLISETAIPAQQLLARGVFFGALTASLRTGVAILNPYPQAIQVVLTPRTSEGRVIATATVTLAPYQKTSAFLDELVPGVKSGFEGTVLMESAMPVYAVALRGTTLDEGDFLMAALPVLNLDLSQAGLAYFPQVVIGESFTTEFFITNAGGTTGVLRFVASNGEPLSVLVQ